MNWTVHAGVAFILGLACFCLLGADQYEILVLALFCGASALLPDLDHVGSKARELLDKLIIFIAVIFTYLFRCSDVSCVLGGDFALRVFAFAGAYFVIFTFFRPEHRGITHSLLLALFFSLLVYFILGPKFALAGAIGYLSHLLLDREIKLI